MGKKYLLDEADLLLIVNSVATSAHMGHHEWLVEDSEIMQLLEDEFLPEPYNEN